MAYPNEFHTNACMSAIKHAGINWFWLELRWPSSGGLGIFGFIQLGAAGIPVQIDQV